MPTPKQERLKFKQGLVIAIISSATTIIATLISTGAFTPRAEADSREGGELNLQQSERIQELEEELSRSIKFSTLSDLSNKYFKRNLEKPAVKDSLRKIIRLANLYKAEQEHYTYKLYKLRKIMLTMPRGNINTRIDNGDRETYKLIQELLKGIEYYEGPLNGDRELTRKALENFQNSMNTYSPGYIKEQNIGILGKSTFASILNMYERE